MARYLKPYLDKDTFVNHIKVNKKNNVFLIKKSTH